MFVSPFPVLEERRGGRKASQYLKPRKQEWFPGKSCSQSQHPRQREQHLRVSPAQDRSWLRHWSHSTSSQGNARTIIRVRVLGGGNANPTSVHQTQFLSLTGSNTSPCLPISKRGEIIHHSLAAVSSVEERGLRTHTDGELEENWVLQHRASWQCWAYN